MSPMTHDLEAASALASLQSSSPPAVDRDMASVGVALGGDDIHGGSAQSVKTEPNPEDAKAFPVKLMEILAEETTSDSCDSVTWMPEGNAFLIVKPEKFVNKVLPKHGMDYSRCSSFSRRLTRWGFQCIKRGPYTGAYFHAYFRRDHPELCHKMKPISETTQQKNRSAGKQSRSSSPLSGTNKGAGHAKHGPAGPNLGVGVGGALNSNRRQLMSPTFTPTPSRLPTFAGGPAPANFPPFAGRDILHRRMMDQEQMALLRREKKRIEQAITNRQQTQRMTQDERCVGTPNETPSGQKQKLEARQQEHRPDYSRSYLLRAKQRSSHPEPQTSPDYSRSYLLRARQRLSHPKPETSPMPSKNHSAASPLFFLRRGLEVMHNTTTPNMLPPHSAHPRLPYAGIPHNFDDERLSAIQEAVVGRAMDALRRSY